MIRSKKYTYTMTGNNKEDIHKAKFFSKFFEGKKGKILDIGCNQGYLRKFLNNSIEYTGLDIIKRFPGCVEFNLNKLCKKKLPFKDKTFDFITASAVIEHLLIELDVFMVELNRIVKDNGFIIITYPNLKTIHMTLRDIFRDIINPIESPEDQITQHHWKFDYNSAKNFSKEYFEIVNFYSYFGYKLNPILKFLEKFGYRGELVFKLKPKFKKGE